MINPKIKGVNGGKFEVFCTYAKLFGINCIDIRESGFFFTDQEMSGFFLLINSLTHGDRFRRLRREILHNFMSKKPQNGLLPQCFHSTIWVHGRYRFKMLQSHVGTQ